MFDLEDEWVWDFWTLEESGSHHLFFLHAPRSLGDPELRHRSARVGHAVSADLRRWTRRPDPLSVPLQSAISHDTLATWTGSAARATDGTFWLFTSGLALAEDGRVQRVGSATSPDLLEWRRSGLVLEADARWYADGPGEVHWRDPFVIVDAAGRWHMYLTAKVPGERGNGVVGHAVSADLHDWEVRPPLGGPNGVFDQLEVISLAEVDGRWVLVFSCLGPEVVGAARGGGGVWTVPVEGPGTPVDLDLARRLTSEALYVGRVVSSADGPVLLAFEHADAEGAFVGGVIDPVPVRWSEDGGGLEIDPAADVPPRWRPSDHADPMAG